MSDKTLTDRIKENAPGIAVGAVGTIAAIVALASNGGTTIIEPPALPSQAFGSQAPDAKPVKKRTWWIPAPHEGQEPRLISCGNSTEAKVDGDDGEGTITVGSGSRGRCTLLLAAHWPVLPTCLVSGGTMLGVKCLGIEHGKATDCVSLDLAVTGTRLTYRCGVKE